MLCRAEHITSLAVRETYSVEYTVAHALDLECDLLAVLVEYVSSDSSRSCVSEKGLVLDLRIDLDDVDHRFLDLLLPIIYYRFRYQTLYAGQVIECLTYSAFEQQTYKIKHTAADTGTVIIPYVASVIDMEGRS